MLFKTVKFLTVFSFFMIAAYAGSANAADCVLHIKRFACTGQEDVSYKKCDGKQECDEDQDVAASEADCAAAATAACDNSRLEITKSKVIRATYKDKALVGGFADDGKADEKGTNFCAGDRPDFNKCQ